MFVGANLNSIHDAGVLWFYECSYIPFFQHTLQQKNDFCSVCFLACFMAVFV